MRPVTALLALLVMLAPLPAVAQAARSTPQDDEVMNYRLSMDKLRKLVEVQRALQVAHDKNPQVFESMDREMEALMKKNGGRLTVAQKASIFERNPEARRVFASAGGNARDWMLTAEAMGDAYMSIEAKKGTVTAPPPTTAAQKANVALLEQNEAEWLKILEEIDKLGDQAIQ